MNLPVFGWLRAFKPKSLAERLAEDNAALVERASEILPGLDHEAQADMLTKLRGRGLTVPGYKPPDQDLHRLWSFRYDGGLVNDASFERYWALTLSADEQVTGLERLRAQEFADAAAVRAAHEEAAAAAAREGIDLPTDGVLRSFALDRLVAEGIGSAEQKVPERPVLRLVDERHEEDLHQATADARSDGNAQEWEDEL